MMLVSCKPLSSEALSNFAAFWWGYWHGLIQENRLPENGLEEHQELVEHLNRAVEQYCDNRVYLRRRAMVSMRARVLARRAKHEGA